MSVPSVTLIDGRSGSGKTEYASALARRVPGSQIVRLDDIYPGWEGLHAGSAAVAGILTSLRWQRWDWATSQLAEWHVLDPDRAIILEGVGALTRASRVLADRAVWLESADSVRRQRALARDTYFAEHWDRWAAQEERLLARENPRALADLVLDGGALESIMRE